MNAVSAIISPLSVLLLKGCVRVLRVSPNRIEPTHGKVITKAEVKFILIGIT
jgi:hypothetical protein